MPEAVSIHACAGNNKAGNRRKPSHHICNALEVGHRRRQNTQSFQLDQQLED